MAINEFMEIENRGFEGFITFPTMSLHGNIKIYIVVNRLSDDRVNPDHALISLTDKDLKDPQTIHEEETSNVLLRSEDMQWASIRPVLSGFAVAGTTMFLFGGTMREYVLMPVDEVNFINMEAPVWKKAPSMKAKRWLSKAVAVDGKIYVFGRTEGCEPWSEVYDIECRKWSDLKTPQGLIDAHAVADPCCLLDTEISGQRLRKILVYNDVQSRLCSYDLITGRWEEDCSYKIQITTGVTQLLSSGKLLFVMSETEWSVFDLESMTQRGEVSGLDGLLDELRRDDLQLCKIVSLGCKKAGTHDFLICYCFQNCYFLESIEIVVEGEIDLNATIRSLGGFRLEEDVYVAHFYAVKTCSDMASSGEERRGHKDDRSNKLLNGDGDGDGETTSLLPPADVKDNKALVGLFDGSTEMGYRVVPSAPGPSPSFSGMKLLVSGDDSSYESLLDPERKTKADWIKENTGVIVVGAITTMITNMFVGYFLVKKLMN